MNRNDILRRPHLKLGLFGANVSSGRSYNMAPERWDPSWPNNVALAQMADEAGLECMIPIARWQGYGGDSNPNGEAWESITWAAGLLSVTKRINVFATVHVPLLLPVVAAKQMATVDHIGQGRFGINVVCGWNEDEFAMFGTERLQHDERYLQGREWWAIIEGIWAGRTFDWDGAYFHLREVQGEPVPYGGGRPMMMNAGTSPAGRQFAIDLADMHFDAVRTPEDDVKRVAGTKAQAKHQGRTLQVWTPVGVVCRPTQQEAEDFTAHIIEHADLGAVGNLAELHRRHAKDLIDNVSAFAFSGEGPVERRVLARGNFCAIGNPDRVAAQIARLHRVGFDGLALNFVNYLDEFPYFVQEVLPRLEAMGVRTKEAT